MKKQSLFALILVLIAVAIFFKLADNRGPEMALTEYIQTVDGLNSEMKSVAEEMQSSMSGLQQQISTGKFDAEKIKSQISAFADQMEEHRGTLAALEPPLEASEHQRALLDQYQTAISVLGESAPMMDIAQSMAVASNRMKADPSQAKSVMADMKMAQEEMMKIQTRVMELATRGQELERQTKEERERLIEKFQLDVAPSD